MTPTVDLYCADLYAGGGGTSTGLAQAAAELGRHPDLVAVNHWDVAIETHRRNHPWARHRCTGLDAIHPAQEVPRGRLDLLVASPECIHHSLARGGKPMCDQSRSSPWLVMKWLQDLYVDSVLIENVPEFRSWGPLGANGRPLPSRKGASFEAFTANLKSLGYNVEWRILTAADYGDATVRERLFLQAKRGRNKKIYWPDKSHGSKADSQAEMFGDRQQWRPARDIIDWSLPSRSIFTRKKPLAPATIERIAAGLKKFCGKYAEPFLVVLRRHADGKSINEPIPALTAGGQHIGLCQPFVLGQQSGSVARSTENPLPTIATDGAISMVQPFLAEYRGNHAGRNDGHRRVSSLKDPLKTQDTSNRFGLVEPFMITAGGPVGQGRTAKGVDDPMPTVLAEDHHAIVQPFISSMEHSSPRSFVTTVNHGGGAGAARNYSIDNPMPTITTVDAWALTEPFICSYYGTQNVSHVSDPLPTVTTKDRFGLVELDGILMDIHFRMLHWRELAAAQSFPPGYDFAGNREQIVRQIGNAVPVRTARALCMSLLG